MMMLGEANHLQRSLQGTQAHILDTIKVLRNSLMSSSGNRTDSVPKSNASCTSVRAEPGRVTDVSMTQTTEDLGTNSKHKHPEKSSSMGTTGNGPYGSMSSEEPQCLSLSSSVLLTSGKIE